MRLRTLALALSLACGFTALAEAKKPPVHHTPKRTSRASKVKPRKARKIKARH